MAQAGVYSFVITSKGKAGITVAVGDREVRGEVLRGAAPAPSQSPSASSTPAASSTPSSTPTPAASKTPSSTPTPAANATGYTLAQVKANNTAANCWTIVDDNVYNLTTWINAHPGGSNAIMSLCGVDGTSAFKSQHAGRAMPVGQLDSLKIGTLK